MLLRDGLQVVLTGGPSASDRAMVSEVAKVAPAPAVLNVAGQMSFGQMAALLQGASLYVGPDTSITHLAASLGIPVIALYGPIDPSQWGPWPPGQGAVSYVSRQLRQQAGKVIVLQGPQPCVPCNKAGCDNHVNSTSDCLLTMAPERVYEEAQAVIGQARTSAKGSV